MIGTALLLLTLLCAAAAPALSEEKSRTKGRDGLTIGITQFPSTFNPMIDSMLAKSYILAMVRRPFVTFDREWKLVCLLCETLPTVENGGAEVVTFDKGELKGRKGLRITWRIRKGATWGDGRPVTVDDVVFAWKVGRHPQSGVAGREPFLRTVAIERIDDRTFVQVLDKLRYDYNQLVPDPMPAHLETEAFSDPKEYRRRTAYDRDPANPGLYYGPYRIARIVSGSHVELVPNGTWWGEKPFFGRIVVRVIGNTAALEANLRAGGIDYAAGELGLSLDQATGLRRRAKDRYRFVFKAGLIYEHIDFNLDNPILKDRRVRRALAHGMDRELMSRQLFGGLQPVAHTNISPLDRVASKEVTTYPFDPKKAAALLDAAGWKRRSDGWRYNAKGERLSLSLMTTAGNRAREQVMEILQAYWRRIGIDIRLKTQPARVYFGRTVTQRQFPAMAMYAWISAPESNPRGTLHSSEIPTADNNWSGQNFPGFRNAEMDRLIERLEVTLKLKDRVPIWKRIQQIYAAELPVLPLYFRANPYVFPRWLKGIRPTGHQFSTTLWVEDWHAGADAKRQ
ncbi:MAG: peptide ABC transporter substrate-binding protein [Rhodospirillaceae bacterium]|nr:peptide ABC transporter substrate-binding protein [Rhodospirillaceae bacterium]MYB14322.1 peptide ABC transporter substrate-binding protein [Rhodospirillaceae bacterium]MYI48911.1 peptide ABC transporter substrate-binding protein [Rhodospirillaceae bacterium]